MFLHLKLKIEQTRKEALELLNSYGRTVLQSLFKTIALSLIDFSHHDAAVKSPFTLSKEQALFSCLAKKLTKLTK